MVRKHNGWMRRLLDRCMRAYEALKLDRWGRGLFEATLPHSVLAVLLSMQQNAHTAVEDLVYHHHKQLLLPLLVFCVRRQRRRLAAAVLQAGWRAQLARRQLTAARAAAVVVQAAWRGHQERSRCARMTS